MIKHKLQFITILITLSFSCQQVLAKTSLDSRGKNSVININAGEFIYKTDHEPINIMLIYDTLWWFKGNQKAGFYITQPQDWDHESDIEIHIKFDHDTNITTPTTIDWVMQLLPLNPNSGDTLLDYEQLTAQNPVYINADNIHATKSQKFTITAEQFNQFELWGIFFERGFESAFPSEETFDGTIEVIQSSVRYNSEAEPTMKNMLFTAGTINREMDRAAGDASIEETFDNALRWNKPTPSNNREGGIRFRVPNDWDHSITGRKVTIYFATASPDSAQTVNWRVRYTAYEEGDGFPVGSLEQTGDQAIAIPSGGYGRVYAQTFNLPTVWLHDLAEIYFARGTTAEGETHHNPLRVLAIDVTYPVSGEFFDYAVQTINPAGLTIFQHPTQTSPVNMVTQDDLLYPKTVAYPNFWHSSIPPNWDQQSDVLFRVYFRAKNNPNTAFGAVHWDFNYANGSELVFINSTNTGKVLYQDFCVPYQYLNEPSDWSFYISRDAESEFESYDDDLNLIAISKVHKQLPEDYVFAAGFESLQNNCLEHKVLLE